MGKYSNSFWTEYIHMFFNHYNNTKRRKVKTSIFSVVFNVVFIVVATSCHLFVSCRPIEHSPRNDQNLTEAMMYLMKYGYMDMEHHGSGRSAPLMSRDGLRKHIIEFQRFAGIEQTGELDDETMKWMHMPRCGVKDIIGNGPKERELTTRKKRFALQGSRWRVKTISYKISRYPTTKRLTNSDVDAEIKKALDVWSEYTDLDFEMKTTGQVHIDIRFEVGEHGDGDPFDGSGGTLAHAFFPVYGGDAHFDDSESWTMNSYTGTNLLQTAAHEFGHSLGLSHSDANAALMAPFYRGFETKPRLNEDDIKAIQALYGVRSNEVNENKVTIQIKPTTIPPKPADNEQQSTSTDDDENPLCRDGSIDAAVSLKDGDTYVFKFSQYWKLTDESVAPGYPRSIAKDWDGLPSNLDAGFTWTNGKTYFFRGTEYWRFTGQKMDEGYPKSIRSGFDGIPSFVDAAFVWSGNGKIYFFKGDKYYRFDPEKRPPVSDGYPKPISNWEGIPNNVDDALQYSNGFTYFFKDGKYWRFNDKKFQVDEADPSFPRPVSYWWFGCKNKPKGRIPKTNTAFGGGRGRNGGGGGGGYDNDVIGSDTFGPDRADVEPKIPDVTSHSGGRDTDAGNRNTNNSNNNNNNNNKGFGFGWRAELWRSLKRKLKNIFS